MPRRDVVDAELAREVESGLFRLAGQEQVVAGHGGVLEVLAAPARHDGSPPDRVRPMRENERLTSELLADAARKALGLGGWAERATEADPGEALLRLDAERLRKQRVVADLRMGVEREVIRGQRDVGFEERFQAPAHRPVDSARVAVPDEPMVDDQKLCVLLDGPLEQGQRRGHAAGDLGDLVGALDLQAHRPVVRVGVEVEQLGGVGKDRVPFRHRAILGSFGYP